MRSSANVGVSAMSVSSMASRHRMGGYVCCDAMPSLTAPYSAMKINLSLILVLDFSDLYSDEIL